METITKSVQEVANERVKWINDDVLVVILLNKNFNFKGIKSPYDCNILGKKMWEWVALGCLGSEIKTTFCTDESDVLTLVKPYLSDKKFTMVLYSDTPLFSSQTFVEIMEYVRAKQTNVVNLPRGYVFNTQYIQNATSILAGETKSFGENDFFTVSNNKKLYSVKNIIKNRILDYHINAGVVIDDKSSTTIDADVIIEAGSTIMQNNAIYGQTYIGKNCVIEPNNVIKDSVISDNCIVKCSYIDESRISENIIVGPFESVVSKSS